MSDAVTFVSSPKPDIDPSRIAIYGAGHTGDVVFQTGSLDSWVKETFYGAFISGEEDAKSLPTGLFDEAWKERLSSIGAEHKLP